MLHRLLLISLWLLTTSAAAQSAALRAEETPEYRAAYPLPRDSLAALNRYAIPVAGTEAEVLDGHRVSLYIKCLRLGKIGDWVSGGLIQ